MAASTPNPLVTINFGEVPFAEAIDALRRYVPMSADQWAALSLNAQRQAFSFAGAASESAAAAVQRVLEQALVDPVRSNFAERANAVLDAYDISLSPRQAETIFDTVMNRAINDGKRQQLSDPDIAAAYPFLGVDTAMDSRVRANHWALDWRRIKTVFRFDDPGWQQMFPPFGFRCRCTVLPFSQADVDARNLEVGELGDWLGRSVVVTMPDGRELPTVIIPDHGFGGGTLTGKESSQPSALSGQCGCGDVHPINLGLIILALHCAQRKAA